MKAFVLDFIASAHGTKQSFCLQSAYRMPIIINSACKEEKPVEGSTCPNFSHVPTDLKIDLILKNHQKIGWIPYKLLSNSLQFNSTPKIFLNLVRNYYQELCFFASQNSVLKSKHLPPSCLLSTFEATNFLTFDNWDWLKIPAVTATSMHSRWTIT